MREKRPEDSPIRWFRNSWVNPWEAEVAVRSAVVSTLIAWLHLMALQLPVEIGQFSSLANDVL